MSIGAASLGKDGKAPGGAMAQLRGLLTAVTNFALPQACVLCAAPCAEHALCAPCHAELPWLDLAVCPICAIPMPTGQVCGTCLARPPAFDTTIAAWSYEWPIDRLIPAWKYRDQHVLAHPLADGLRRRAELTADRPALLLPLPLHRSRQIERGFNQAYELSKILGHALQIPTHVGLIERSKPTPPLANLPWDQRQRAIKGAFAVTGDVVDQHIAIVDDVMTTGASLHELAKTLKAAGARRVDCWVLARTVKS
jgi:ComF family protein